MLHCSLVMSKSNASSKMLSTTMGSPSSSFNATTTGSAEETSPENIYYPSCQSMPQGPLPLVLVN